MPEIGHIISNYRIIEMLERRAIDDSAGNRSSRPRLLSGELAPGSCDRALEARRSRRLSRRPEEHLRWTCQFLWLHNGTRLRDLVEEGSDRFLTDLADYEKLGVLYAY